MNDTNGDDCKTTRAGNMRAMAGTGSRHRFHPPHAAFLFLCLLLAAPAGCGSQAKMAASPVKPAPDPDATEWTLSPRHRTEDLLTLLSIAPNGRVRVSISHRPYSARVGEFFAAQDTNYPSDYVLKAVNRATGQVVVQIKMHAYPRPNARGPLPPR